MDKPSEIRGLMITVTNGRVLLPNANVTEIITFSTPEAIENAPNWLLGRTRWRGWRVPLVSFSILAGLSDREGGKNAKVTVLKALGGNPKMPVLAIVAQGAAIHRTELKIGNSRLGGALVEIIFPKASAQ